MVGPARKGLVAILAGTAAGQLLALFAAPVLARLYTARDFGLFATISAVIVIVGTLGPARFELAIPLPASDRHAFSLTHLALFSTVVVSAGTALTLALAGDDIAGAFGQPELMPWLWVVPVGVLALGTYQSLNQLAIREQRYTAVRRI